MRCLGRTKSLNRCKNQTKRKFAICCNHHSWQPWGLVLITIPAILGSYAGIFRDLIEPITVKDKSGICYSDSIKKPIKIKFRDLYVSEYDPKTKLSFSIKFHLRNYSDCVFTNYRMVYYGVSIGNGKDKPIMVKSQTMEHSEFRILPEQEFSLNSGVINWHAPKKDLKFEDFIGVVNHEYSDERGETKILDTEYYWLVYDSLRSQLSTGVPPDYIIDRYEAILDTLVVKNDH